MWLAVWTLTVFLNVANAGSIQLNLPVIGGFGPGLSPASFINYIVIAAFAFVGISALLMLVVGGVKYLTAAVDPKAESDAKDQIVSALLGLLVVFAAIILLNTLNPDFVRLRDPGLPIFELPEPRIISPAVEGSCAITAASWRANTSCYNTVSKTYDEVLMGTQGRNCTGWGASFNIKDVETNAVVETVGGRFESDFLQASWQPKRAGTYAFEVIAGSENTRTSAESSGRLTVTADPCGPAISPGGRCQIAPSGPCTVQNLQETCMSVHAYEASGICNVESSGRVSVPSGTDLCADGNSVSWGLFQINISAHRLVDPATDAILDCPLAFANGPYTASNKTCTVRDRDLYDRCVALAINPDVNIAKACVLSCNGTRWGRWGANNVCSYAGGNCNDPIDR